MGLLPYVVRCDAIIQKPIICYFCGKCSFFSFKAVLYFLAMQGQPSSRTVEPETALKFPKRRAVGAFCYWYWAVL
jgi:hypothetical protein